MIYYHDADVEIRTSTLLDAESLKTRLKPADVRELALANGNTPEKALWDAYYFSSVCLTAHLRGNPLLMFGLNQPVLTDASSAVIWLLGSADVATVSRKFIRLSRQFVQHFLQTHETLYNFISVEHEESIRWLKRLGAEFSKPKPYGVDGAQFMKFTIRRASHV